MNLDKRCDHFLSLEGLQLFQGEWKDLFTYRRWTSGGGDEEEIFKPPFLP